MDSKVLIGNDRSKYIKISDEATRRADTADAELTMIRRRIRTFYSAITVVRFPASPPYWVEDWVEWLETGKVARADSDKEEVVE